MRQRPDLPGHLPVLHPFRIAPARPLDLGALAASPWLPMVLIGVLAAFLIPEAWAQEAEARPSRLSLMLTWTPLIAKGFAFNILISVLAMSIGTVLGVILGILQTARTGPVRRAAWVVTQFFRNSPWLVLLFYCILLIPFEVEVLGQEILFPGWIKAVIGLSLPVMAYISEYVRGAIQSIPSGQWEAAASIGFSPRQTMREVILPQTVARVLPPWMNTYAVLLMATPIVSIVGVDEAMGLTRAALSAINRVDMLIPMYLYILCWFFAASYPIGLLTRRLERRHQLVT